MIDPAQLAAIDQEHAASEEHFDRLVQWWRTCRTENSQAMPADTERVAVLCYTMTAFHPHTIAALLAVAVNRAAAQ